MDGLTITMVKPTARQLHRNAAWRLARVANKETRYDFGVYDPSSAAADGTHALLGHYERRTVGLLVADVGATVLGTTWSDYLADRGVWRERAEPKRLLVSFVWIAVLSRDRGFGSRMVEAAAKAFEVTPAEIAWHDPFTPEGEALAKRFQPERLYLGRPL